MAERSLICASFFLFVSCTPDRGETQDQKPNIVFIFADDMGYGDVAALNPEGRTETPAIDRMVSEGITFTQAHASASVCTPSRYGLLTGRYAYRTSAAARGVRGFNEPVIEPEKETVADMLKQAGYTTAIIGKWHLGLGWQTDDGSKAKLDEITGYSNVDYSKEVTKGPNDYGFDYSFIHPASLDIPPYMFLRNHKVIDTDIILTTDHYPDRMPDTEYSWDKKHSNEHAVYWEKGVWWRLGEMSRSFRIEDAHPEIINKSLQYIDDQAANGFENPFFLYIPLTGPHTPWVPTERFKGQSEIGLYGDFIMDIDDVVDQIQRALVNHDIHDNTILIFASDNGAYWPQEEIDLHDHDSNWGRLGQKGDIWDGGHRIPLIITWPDGIKQPAEYNHLISLTDFYATFAEMTGQEMNEDMADDSFSFLQVMYGEVEKVSRESMIHHSPRGMYSIRKDGWKLIDGLGSGGFTEPSFEDQQPGGPKGQLYKVSSDSLEADNLYLQHPDKVERLQQHLQVYKNTPERNLHSGENQTFTNSAVTQMSYAAIEESDNQSLPLVDKVYPLIDSAHSRWFFFSSATRPFGMVNLSPDMAIDGAWESGYRYNKDTIKVFSHIHAWQLSGVPVLPTTGAFRGHMGPDHYGSFYTRDKEEVRAGYHKVVLEDYDVTAELTSTTRVGFHRYTWPASDQSYILFDFTTVLGPSATLEGSVEKVSDTELQGYSVMGGTIRRPKPVTVYFVAQFDKPFASFSGWRDGELVPVDDVIEGENTGAYVQFATGEGEVRKMKVGISYVSIDQARLNLQTELPHWDFDRVVQESREEWNRWLSRIEVEGGTEKQQRRFYTDLWKALQGRRIVSDVNGKYLDMTGEEPRIGQIPLDEHGQPLFNHHNSDSFWGAQWSLNTLWHLVYPEVTEDFVNSMLMMYDDGGLIPRGPSGGNYTYVMTGASTTPFIVSAWLKGIRGFDVDKAYEGLRKNHFPGGLMSKAGYEHDTFKGGGIEYYMERGYIPYPLYEERYGFHQAGAGQTLEYAYQDWALSQLAKVLGKDSDYEMFSARSLNYKNLWNAEIGWMWVKDRNGNWLEPFDLLDYGRPWVEGNAAHFTWWVPHDVQGLANLMGGNDGFNTKLNQSFEYARQHDFVGYNEETNRYNNHTKGYINYSNQPNMQTAWLFNHSGAPWLTQYWTRQVIDKVYSRLSPNVGYRGDEDQGLMGSLAALIKMGIFSVDGGVYHEPFYEIGSPIFDKITIHLNPEYYPGGKFVIRADNNGPDNYYIQSAELNGEDLNRPWMPHDVVVQGGELRLKMGPNPNKEWGSHPDQAPPSRSR